MGFELTEEEQEEIRLFENEQGSGLDVEPEFDDLDFSLSQDEEDEISNFDGIHPEIETEESNDFVQQKISTLVENINKDFTSGTMSPEAFDKADRLVKAFMPKNSLGVTRAVDSDISKVSIVNNPVIRETTQREADWRNSDAGKKAQEELNREVNAYSEVIRDSKNAQARAEQIGIDYNESIKTARVANSLLGLKQGTLVELDEFPKEKSNNLAGKAFEQLDEWFAGEDEVNVYDKLRDRNTIRNMIPFAGSIYSAGNKKALNDATRRLNEGAYEDSIEGDKLKAFDRVSVEKYIEQISNDHGKKNTIGAKAADIASNMVGLMGEFAVGGPLAKGILGGTAGLTSMLAKTANLIGRGAIITGTAGLPRLADDTIERMSAKGFQFNKDGSFQITEDGDDFGDAFTNALISQTISNSIELGGGEVVGAALGKMGKAITSKLKGPALEKGVAQFNKLRDAVTKFGQGKSPEFLNKTLSKAEFGGFMDEFFEERLDSIAQVMAGTTDEYSDAHREASDWIAEALALGGPSALRMISNRTGKREAELAEQQVNELDSVIQQLEDEEIAILLEGSPQGIVEAQSNAEAQADINFEVDKKLAKMDFEDQVKETQTLIKEIAEKARATKDPAAKRELVGQVVQLEEELGFMKEQDPDALAEEQEESDAIDQEASEEFTFDAEKKVATPKRINEEADSKTQEEHFQDLVDKTKAETEVVTEEDVTRLDEIEDKIGVSKGIITGKEYDTTQANIIREIAKEEGISENEATMEYLKKDSKQFAKEHSIEQVETNESKAAAEGVGTTFDSNDNDLSGTANIAVAEHPELTKIVKGKLTPENATKEVGKYREKNADLLTKNPDMAVGTWYDEESDQTYIDVSTIIPKAQMDKAIQRGKDANQKAIFDLETFEEIDTGGTGEDIASEKKPAKPKKEDLASGEKPLVKAPKLAEAIQELKTKQEQEQTARREKVAKARKTSPKERAKGFKEVTGVADTSPIVTKTAKQTVKDTMNFLESQSKKIATGVRSEISEMQRDLAKITRETLPPSLRGNLIGKINSLVKIKNPELRVEKFNEAVQFVKDTLAKSEKKTAINSLKKTIVDISKKQKKVTSKKGREGFGTKETAETAKKVVTLRAESSKLGKQLSKTTDKKTQAELKRKISKKNQEAALLEAFNDLTNAAESPNEAIRSELSKLMSIPNTRIKKMETAQAEYAEGKLESIPEAIQKDIDAIANGQINIDQLSTQDANELNFKLQALAAGKKAVAAHIHNQNKQQAQARLTLALQELTKNNDVQVQSGPKKDVKGGAVAGLKGYVRRPSLMLQELFGGSDTTGYANTYGKVTQAANNAQVIAESFNQAKADIFSKINEKVVGDGLDFYDALTKPLVEINGKQHSTNEVMELYSLSQSPDGQRILDNTGYKTDSKVYADMLGKDYVEAVDKYLDFLSKEMYETLNVEYKRQHGVDMPTVDGKYFPLISLEVAYKGDALSLEDLGQQYVMPKLNDGMTHERVPHNYKLGSLDFFGKTSLYEKRAARYAGEAELLSQVDQLMNSTELQNTINAVNKHYGTASKLWIKQVIAGSQFEQTTHDALWDSVFTLKTNFVRSVLPLRLSVIAKQIPSFFGGTPQLTVKGFGDAEHAFLNASAINDYVDGKSVMMRNRAGESMQRLSENIKVSKSGEAVVNNEALRTAKKGVHILKNTSDAAFSRGIGAVDKYVTNALWYGKYKDEIRAGKNEAEAIASADTLINTTQPNFQNKDLSQMNRNRIVSLFKMFSSQLDQNLNRVIDVLVGKKMGLSAKERGTRAQGVVQSTVLISLTTLLFRWAQSYYSDDEENKVEPLDYIAENFAKQFSSDITHGVFGGLPVINTGLDILTQSSYNKLTDERATFYEYRTALQGVMKAPIGQVADDVLQAYNFSISDEPEKALSALRSAIEKAGGIPYSGAKSSFKQVGGLVKYLLDQLPDGDHRKEQLKELKF